MGGKGASGRNCTDHHALLWLSLAESIGLPSLQSNHTVLYYPFSCIPGHGLFLSGYITCLVRFTVILRPVSPCLDGFFLAFCRSWTGRFKTFVFTWKVDIPNIPFFCAFISENVKKGGILPLLVQPPECKSSWCETYFVEHRQFMTFRKQFRWEVWERTMAIAKIFAEVCNRFCRSWQIFVTPIP